MSRTWQVCLINDKITTALILKCFSFTHFSTEVLSIVLLSIYLLLLEKIFLSSLYNKLWIPGKSVKSLVNDPTVKNPYLVSGPHLLPLLVHKIWWYNQAPNFPEVHFPLLFSFGISFLFTFQSSVHIPPPRCFISSTNFGLSHTENHIFHTYILCIENSNKFSVS